MVYNLLDGGVDSAGDRTEGILAVIERENPDVLGLCECRDFDRDGGSRLRLFCDRLRMVAVMNTAASGSHVALLHRREFRRIEEHVGLTAMFHGYARVVLGVEGFERMAVVVTHLHPFSSLQRAAEAQTVLVQSLYDDATIVMGDLNSLSPSDAAPNLSRAPSRLRARLSDASGQIDFGPVAMFLKHGFAEVGPPEPTYPTSLGHKRSRYGCQVRLDHVLASPVVAKRSIRNRVPRDSDAERASDHLPVVVEVL